MEEIAAAGKEFVDVGLMADVKNELIFGSVENVVQS
jgi:hypothetical protein